MGLDIYVGPLTRYYSHNWKTVSQQWAEANGMGYQRFQANEDGGEDLPVEQVIEIVSHWRDSALEAVKSAAGEVEPWPEDNDRAYYTEKPDWPAFGALLLYAAAKIYGEAYPATVPKDWDFWQEPLIQRAQGDVQVSWSLFKGAEWWLPIQAPLLFRGENPVGDTLVVSTAGALMLELLRINELGWKADEEAVLSWSKTEGYPQDGTLKDGKLEMEQEHTEYSTVSLARFAYSIFWQAAKFSLQHQAPILLDY